MTEVDVWAAIQPRLRRLDLDPVRIENGLTRATPDVNYTHGWIELKQCDGWPPRSNLKVDFQFGQVGWLMKRWKAGGPCWVLVRVRRELLLFSGWDSRAVESGELSQADLRSLAAWHWTTKHDWPSMGPGLRALLRWEPQSMPLPMRAQWHRLVACQSREDLAKELGFTVLQIADAERNGGKLVPVLLEHWEDGDDH